MLIIPLPPRNSRKIPIFAFFFLKNFDIITIFIWTENYFGKEILNLDKKVESGFKLWQTATTSK